MKIKTITFTVDKKEFLDESTRVTAQAELEEGEDPAIALDELEAIVRRNDEFEREIDHLRTQRMELENQIGQHKAWIQAARRGWQTMNQKFNEAQSLLEHYGIQIERSFPEFPVELFPEENEDIPV